MLVTEITSCWWRMHVCEYVYISLFSPHYGCEVTTHFSLYVPTLQFHFLSITLWNPFCDLSNSPKVFYCLITSLAK